MSLLVLCRSALVLFVVLASACGASVTGPGQVGPVRLTAHVNRIQIAPGATAVVTLRLENLTSSPVTLDFGSACQVMPYVVRRPGNEIVYPSGGGWGCAAVVTSLTLPANGVVDRELEVIAGETSGDRVGLLPGDYVFFARLHDRVYKLESNRVTLQVL
ncbi:MAG: hypothetical protein WD690_04250 [Vicinamibacterales bacterium]